MKMDFTFLKEKIKGNEKEEVYFIEKIYFVFILLVWLIVKTLCLNLPQINKYYPIIYIFSSYFLIILSCVILVYVLKTMESQKINFLKQVINVLNFVVETYLLIILSLEKREDIIILRYIYCFIITNIILGLYFLEINITLNVIQFILSSIVLFFINNQFKLNINFEIVLNAVLYLIFYIFYFKSHFLFKKFLKKFNANNELCNIYNAILPSQPLIFKLNMNNTLTINKGAQNFFKKIRENEFVQLNMESQTQNENKAFFEHIGIFNEVSRDYYSEILIKEESDHQSYLSFLSKLTCTEHISDILLQNNLKDKRNLLEMFSILIDLKEFEETDKLKFLGEFMYTSNITNFEKKNTSTICPLKEIGEINIPHLFRVYIRKEKIENQTFIHLLLNIIPKIDKKQEKVENEEKETTFDEFKQSVFQFIAHEFKTPIISIISSLEKSDTEKEVELPKIKQLSNYMIFLVNNLIDYATNNNIQLSFEEISAESFLDFSYEILQMIINYHEKAKKIKLKSKIDKNLRGFIIYTDKYRLLQIIFTLSSITIKNCNNGIITLQAYLNHDGIVNLIITSSSSFFNYGLFNRKESSNDPKNLLYGLGLSQKIAKLLGTEIKFKSDSLNKCYFSLDIINNIRTTNNKKSKEHIDDMNKLVMPNFLKRNKEKSFDLSYFNSENSQSNEDSSENKDVINKVKSINVLEEIKENSSSSQTDEQLSFVKIEIEEKDNEKIKYVHKKEKAFQSKFLSKDTIILKSQAFLRPPDLSHRNNTSNSIDLSDKFHTQIYGLPNSFPKPFRTKSSDGIIKHFKTNEDINLHIRNNKYLSTRGSFKNFVLNGKTFNLPDKEYVQNNDKNDLVNIRWKWRKSFDEMKRNNETLYNINHFQIFTILIIDDYRFCRVLLENIISQLILPKYKGLVKIEHGNDGVCLLYKYVNHLDDLENIIVFIDEDMEFMKGSEAVSQIRKWEKERSVSKQIKISSITAFNDEMTKEKIKESGVDYIIQKPPKKSDINKIFEDLGIYDKMQSIFTV